MLYAITDHAGALVDVVEGSARQAVASAWLLGPCQVVYDASQAHLALEPRSATQAVANPFEESKRDLDRLDPQKAPTAAHKAMGGLVIKEDDVRAMDLDEAHEILYPYFRHLRLTQSGLAPQRWKSAYGMRDNLLRQNYKTEKSHPAGSVEVQGLSLLPARMWGTMLNGDDWLSAQSGRRARRHNFCIGASEWCEEACLVYSGRQQVDRYNTALKEATVDAFLAEPTAFGRMLWAACLKHQGSSPSAGEPRARSSEGTVPFIRLNVLSDIPWELVFPSLFEELIPPKDQHDYGLWFYDYTKVPGRNTDELPGNYDLTFSFSGANLRSSEYVLNQGGKVAVVFFKRTQSSGRWKSHDYFRGRIAGTEGGPFPARFLGAEVVDGDISDVRPYDDLLARGKPPYIVGLKYKPPAGQSFDPVNALFVVPCWEVDGEIVTIEVPRNTPGTLRTIMDNAEQLTREYLVGCGIPELGPGGEEIIPVTRLAAKRPRRKKR